LAGGEAAAAAMQAQKDKQWLENKAAERREREAAIAKNKKGPTAADSDNHYNTEPDKDDSAKTGIDLADSDGEGKEKATAAEDVADELR